MKVAIVNETLPYPPTAGNRIRTLNLMQRLARRHEITYITRAGETQAQTQEAVDYLAGQKIRTVIADGPPGGKHGAAFYAGLAINSFRLQPYAVRLHNSRRLRAAIGEMARNGEFDLWQFEWFAYADAVAQTPGARTLVMAHNIESLIWKRYWQTETSLAKRVYLRQEYAKFRRFERHILQGVSGVVCVSDEDARLATREFSPKRVWVVDNGVDRAFFQGAADFGPRQPSTILFLGSLEWRPNLEAVRLLLKSIFPSVLDRMPEARLCIVGRRPPQWLRDQVSRASNVELHGDVADVRQYLGSASVMAVPLLVGGGSRLKILEAMACGLPVVSTPVGCEGLAVTHGREICVVNSVNDFAAGLIWAMRNPREMQAMAECARALAYEHYDWDVLAGRLETAWEQLLRAPAEQIYPAAAQVAAAVG